MCQSGESKLNFKDLTVYDEYRSDRSDLIQDFYIPCLEKATIYSRAVGFFSSTSMAAAAQGITALIRAGGKMQLIASPYLSAEDADAIDRGLKQREEVVANVVIRELEQEFEQIVQDRLASLAWLLAEGFLEIKLAIPKNVHKSGIYHEKLGIFSDREGNIIAFSGSANESHTALIDNFECIDVFCSWHSGVKERALRKAENFQQLWSNCTPNLEVISFPEAATRSLLRLRPDSSYQSQPIQRTSVRENSPQSQGYTWPVDRQSLGCPKIPPYVRVRPYQQQAVDNWFANEGRGTLKMATGSGKTITSLLIACKLYQKIGLKALLVVCPYRHLVTQWARECQKFGLEPVLAFENAHKWQPELSTQLYNLISDRKSFLTVITTNSTLMSPGLQSLLPDFPRKTLIVGDEAHNLGSKKLEESLPRNIGLRLALSATPERHFDDRGTESLLNYFGNVLQPEFTLADAIQQGALVHYLYYPILVDLTDTEAETYMALTAKIGRVMGMGGDEEKLTKLLMQRSRLIGAASNKLQALRDLMQGRLDTQHTLFYCGDGSVEDRMSQETNKQLEAVVRILGSELGYRVNTYTAEVPLDEREDLRHQFETGELQGLVAIRCLDEGVDIPATQTAVILASSTNPRQFIQRRGRILRPHPNKRRATLFDTIVLPPELERESLEVERNLLRKELRRFVEFADLADNAGEARIKLMDVQSKYGLLDL
jgi:DNA phosphorothioation system restriction enzyme